MHVFALGASRATGYHVALNFLEKGDMVSIPLRTPGTLETDEAMKKYLEDGKLVLYACDAMKAGDIARVWAAAIERAPVDLVFFGIGPGVRFEMSSLARGGIAVPPNASTVCFLNVIQAIYSTSTQEATGSSSTTNVNVEPKLVVLSAGAVTPSSLSMTPFPIRSIVSWAFHGPNVDKRGMETIVFHGWKKPYEEGMTPAEDEGVLPPLWQQRLPAEGWAKHVVVIRPPGLTDGKETGRYEARTETFRTLRMSRRDLARFVSKDLVEKWSTYEGHVVTIG
ncbi:hypothetical protein FRC17_005260 [Serendipita sp. 399]|nr:hypothetical protein FRC17_005260 [Serendipita sp. 399]